MIKKCLICGQEFEPSINVQRYCNRTIKKICKTCGKEFEAKCNASSPEFCSPSCIALGSKFKTFICVNCGQSFHPASSRQRYCKQPIHKFCPVCREDFTYPCSDRIPDTCGKKNCIDTFAKQKAQEAFQKETRICAWCGKEFHPINNKQRYCDGPHFTKCAICGREFEIDLGQTAIRATCSDECKYKFRSLDKETKEKFYAEIQSKRCLN